MTHPERQLFTVTVYSENCVGLLNQVSVIFTRRCLNIEDVTASASSVSDIHKLTLTTWADRPTMEKVVRQIEKRVDVIRAFLYTDDDIVYQEIALYKVPTARLLETGDVEDIVRHHGARILEMTPRVHRLRKDRPPLGDRSPARQSSQLRHPPVCPQRTSRRDQIARRICRPLSRTAGTATTPHHRRPGTLNCIMQELKTWTIEF